VCTAIIHLDRNILTVNYTVIYCCTCLIISIVSNYWTGEQRSH